MCALMCTTNRAASLHDTSAFSHEANKSPRRTARPQMYPSWAPLGVLLVPTWLQLGPTWVPVGPSWRPLGSPWGAFGDNLCSFLCFFVTFSVCFFEAFF